MEYYDPSEVGIDELTKRIRVGSKTKEFLATGTGKAIIEGALSEYHKGIEELQKMILVDRSSGDTDELKKYRSIASDLASPLRILKWLDGVIADGDNAYFFANNRDLDP